MKDFPLALIIKAVDRATGPLKRINDRMEAMMKPMRAFRTEWERFGKLHGFDRVGTAIDNVGRRFSRVSREIKSGVFTILAGGTALGYVFKTQLVDVAAEFERLNVMLLSTEKGDKSAAANSFKWIQQFAFDTPLTLAETADAFVKLRNWGIDPTTGRMKALVDQMARMGKGKEGLDKLILAMGQVTAKGKIRAGEVNQLTEAGVAVYGWLAERLTGTTSGKRFDLARNKLMKMGELGQLGPKYIDMLWDEIAKRGVGASDALAKTWNGLISRFEDLYQIFANMVMQSGVFDYMKGKLEAMITTVQRMMKDGTLDRWAKQAGVAITETLTAIWEALPGIWNGFMSIGRAVSAIAKGVGGWENLIVFAGIIMAGPFIMAMWSLVTVLWATAAAIAAVSAPVALLLGFWALLGAAVLLVAVYWDEAVAWIVDQWEFLSLVWTKGIEDLTAMITDWNLGTIIGDALTAAFAIAAAYVPDWFKQLVGGTWNLGASIGGDIADYFGAGDALPQAAPVRNVLDVNLNGLPRGTRYVAPNPLLSGVNVSAGYSMRDSW